MIGQRTPWGSMVRVLVSQAAPDATPDWVDITEWVIVPNGATVETWLGRVTELVAGEPGHFQLTLNNRDGRFTPGNPLSPYFPWFKQQRRLQIREYIGYQGFDLTDGYLQIPEVMIDYEVVGTSDNDILLTVSGVDLIGRRQSGRRFISTLAAHIKFNGGATLIHYWPCGDTALPPAAAVGNAATRIVGPEFATPASQAGPPGEDLSFLRFHPFNGTDIPTVTYAVADVGITVSSGQTLAISAWVRNDPFPDPAPLGGGDYLFSLSDAAGQTALMAVDSQSTGLYATGGGASSPPYAVAEAGRVLGREVWRLVTARVSLPSGVVDLWAGNDIVASDPIPVPPGSMTFTEAQFGGALFWGAIGHVQVYLGDNDVTFTYEQHLAQVALGFGGLEQQTTGERVNTIADYAGVPSGLRDIDPGVARMQRVSLAGKTAADAWAEAVDTERGRLLATGGRLTFHDRLRVYDI